MQRSAHRKAAAAAATSGRPAALQAMDGQTHGRVEVGLQVESWACAVPAVMQSSPGSSSRARARAQHRSWGRAVAASLVVPGPQSRPPCRGACDVPQRTGTRWEGPRLYREQGGRGKQAVPVQRTPGSRPRQTANDSRCPREDSPPAAPRALTACVKHSTHEPSGTKGARPWASPTRTHRRGLVNPLSRMCQWGHAPSGTGDHSAPERARGRARAPVSWGSQRTAAGPRSRV